MPYFMPLQAADNIVVSVDMIRIRYPVDPDETAEMVRRLSSKWQLDSWETSSPLPSPQIGKYKWLFRIPAGITHAILLAGLYNEDGLQAVVDLEFNPNKALGGPLSGNTDGPLRDLLAWLWRHGDKDMSPEILRFDLAADFYGVPRGSVWSRVSDPRMPSSVGRGHTRTATYGARSRPGQLKIYNKAAEAGLDEDCTRIELTCKREWLSDSDMLRRQWGEHFSLDRSRLDDLPDLVRALIPLMELDPDYGNQILQTMERHRRKKYESLLQAGSRPLVLPLSDPEGLSLVDWFSMLVDVLMVPQDPGYIKPVLPPDPSQGGV